MHSESESLEPKQEPKLPEWKETLNEKSLAGFLTKELVVRAISLPALAYGGLKRALKHNHNQSS